jgi:hypothetical protein
MYLDSALLLLPEKKKTGFDCARDLGCQPTASTGSWTWACHWDSLDRVIEILSVRMGYYVSGMDLRPFYRAQPESWKEMGLVTEGKQCQAIESLEAWVGLRY